MIDKQLRGQYGKGQQGPGESNLQSGRSSQLLTIERMLLLHRENGLINFSIEGMKLSNREVMETKNSSNYHSS